MTGGCRRDEREDLEVLHPPTEHELMQRLNTLEFANVALNKKVERLEKERELYTLKTLTLQDIQVPTISWLHAMLVSIVLHGARLVLTHEHEQRLEENYHSGEAMQLSGEESRLLKKEKKLARLQKFNDVLLSKVGSREQRCSARRVGSRADADSKSGGH